MLISLDKNFSVDPNAVTGVAVVRRDTTYCVMLTYSETNSFSWTYSTTDKTVPMETLESQAQEFANSLRAKVNDALSGQRRR